MKTLNEKCVKLIELFFLVVAGFVFICLVFACLKEDIWFDEVFSASFARHSYSEITSLTAEDVHPPLYYFYLKFTYTLIISIFHGAKEITVYKIASLFPVLATGAYVLYFDREKKAIRYSFIFLLLFMTMPQINSYMIEIRMYSLALFFVTAAFLHAYGIVTSHKTIHWFFFSLYGILTAYTQYYACVAIIGLYIMLFLYLLKQKEQKKKNVLRWAGCVGISIAAYIPWLPALFHQVAKVSDSYWIEPLSLRSVAGCMKYVFLPVSYDITIDYALAVCMMLSCAVSLFFIWKSKMKKEEVFFVGTGLFIPFFVFAVGLVCSMLNRPIFIYRYLIPALGVFWLSISYTLGKNVKNRIALILLVPFILGGYFNLKGLYVEENKKQTEMDHTESVLSQIPQDAVIVSNFDHVQAVTGFYLPNNIFLYENEPEELISKLLPNCKTIADDIDIQEELKKQPVYFFGSFQVRDDIVKRWEEKGIRVTELDSCLLERYWFNVYLLEMEK